MPVFEYRCLSCNTKYEIFHYTKEKEEDIICPKCKSNKYEKLLSTFSSNISSSNNTNEIPSACQSCCQGNSCGLNY